MTTAGPARNRVTPAGDIVAVNGRGAWMGNRGRLHDGSGTRDIVRTHRGKMWITCRLSFKDRRVQQWDARHYTPLFVFDEAVAFAAGHRPCGECRHDAYQAYRQAWIETHGGTESYAKKCYAKNIDDQLHRERLDGCIDSAPWTSLPDGAFVLTEHGPAVVTGDHLVVWDDADYSYQQHLPRPPAGDATVLTPPSNVDVLRAGYPIQIDDGARQSLPAHQPIEPGMPLNGPTVRLVIQPP
jgi:hypothetical protein